MCYQYSQVARDEAGIRVHRLVQQVVRAQLAEQDRRVLIATSVELLAAGFPPAGELGDPARWRHWAQLVPHVLIAVDHAEPAGLAAAAIAIVLQRAGTYLRYRADYKAARELLTRALSLQERALRPNHLKLSVTLNSLGTVLHDQGDLAGARAHLERALVISEAALGPDHPDVGEFQRGLGRLLRDQGDLDGARTHLQRAHSILEATRGPEHSDTQTAARWVASL